MVSSSLFEFHVRSVPFTIGSLYAGLGQCHGMVYDEGDFFRFEFQIKDTISGMIKTNVKQVRIPVTKIVSAELVKGWFRTHRSNAKIVLQASSLDAFQDIPGMSHGKVELSVSPINVPLAEAFVEGLYQS